MAIQTTRREVASRDGAISPIDLQNPALYTNRDLSLLDFNERVLAEARDERNPLLERVKFLAITASNMDEFFQKRVGWLKRALLREPRAVTVDGLSIAEQAPLIRARCVAIADDIAGLWEDELRPALASEGLRLVRYGELDADGKEDATEYFDESIFPTLTPLAVDPTHPFPFISTLSLSLALVIRNPKSREERFARVKVPANRSRFISVAGRFVALEEVIGAHARKLFPGMQVVSWHLVRVTRSLDVDSAGEEGDDLIELVEDELRRRRLAPAVRLEISSNLPQAYLKLLLEELELDEEDVFVANGLLDHADLMEIALWQHPALRDRPYAPALPRPFARIGTDEARDLFAAVRERDLLVHHPYESFDRTITEFVQRAGEDPNVLAIKQTLYRTTPESPIVESLIEAAEDGKQVAVLLELRARLDEANNIEWGNKLERAGVHVAYGVSHYKIHSKIALIVREEASGVRLYGHISTGNYNSSTARVYTDYGLFTANPQICNDLVQVFNYLTGYAQRPHCKELLVAPFTLRSTLVENLQREIEAARRGEPARVIFKMNALEDYEFTRLLYEAAQAGVKVDLIIRGICRIQPGAAGSGDNIRVVSVVGKYLEHSRVFSFHNGGDPLYWIGSADLMKRNLDERIEVLAPIHAQELKDQLQRNLDMLLADRRQGWRLNGKDWSRDQDSDDAGVHRLLEEAAPFS